MVFRNLFLLMLPLVLTSCEGGEPPIRTASFELGVNIHLDSSAKVAQVAQMGARWVRIDLDWEWAEREEGKWDFAPFDRAMDSRSKSKTRLEGEILVPFVGIGLG
jgi:hypothetical protein